MPILIGKSGSVLPVRSAMLFLRQRSVQKSVCSNRVRHYVGLDNISKEAFVTESMIAVTLSTSTMGGVSTVVTL